MGTPDHDNQDRGKLLVGTILLCVSLVVTGLAWYSGEAHAKINRLQSTVYDQTVQREVFEKTIRDLERAVAELKEQIPARLSAAILDAAELKVRISVMENIHQIVHPEAHVLEKP